MTRLYTILAIIALCLVHTSVSAQNIYDVSIHGAVPDDGVDDYVAIQAAIDAALGDSGDVIIHFPSGQYDIQALPSMSQSALDLHGTAGSNPTSVRIESGSTGPAEIVMTPTSSGANIGCIEVRELQNVTITGLKIDYRLPSGAPTTFTQGKVLAVSLGTQGSPGSAFIELLVDDGYLPPNDTSVRTYPINPDTMGFRGGVANRGIREVTEVGTNTKIYKMVHQVIDNSLDNLQVNDLVAFPNGAQGNPVILIEDTIGSTMSDLEINAGPQMAVIVRSSTDTVVEGVQVIPGAAPNPTSRDRLISTNRDGIHISDNRGLLEVRNCDIIATDDDGITSHGFSFDVTDILPGQGAILPAQRIRVTERKSHQSPIQPGDELRLYDMATSTYITETVDTVTLESAGGDQGLDVYVVKMAAQLYPGVWPDTDNLHVANLETVGSGISFTNNYCQLNAGRGIMIWGSNGTISNNTTYQTLMNGIGIQNNMVLPMLPGEEGTWDAAASQHVTISNNVILNAGEGDSTVNTFRGGLVVYNSTRNLDTGMALAQNWFSADLFLDIVITDNYFESVHGPNILISNATDVEVTNNTFVKVNVENVGAAGPRPIHRTAVVNLEYVDQIVFAGNEIFLTNPRSFRAIPNSVNLYVADTENCTQVTPILADRGFLLHP